MPKIINAYSDANNSIADSLKSIGQSIWGDEAKNEGLRQNAEKLRRENSNAEPYARAMRDNDMGSARYYGAMHGLTPEGIGIANRVTAAGRANGNYDDPTLGTSMLGAGEAMSSTPEGQRRAMANQRAMEQDRTNAESFSPVMGEDYSGNKQPAGSFNKRTGQYQPLAGGAQPQQGGFNAPQQSGPPGMLNIGAVESLEGTPHTGGGPQGLMGQDLAEWLKTNDPATFTRATRILEGEEQPPRSLNKRGQALLDVAARLEPGYDANQWSTRYKARQNFAPGGGGKGAESVRALNQGILHLGDVADAAQNLHNYNTVGGVDSPLTHMLNTTKNAWGANSNNSAPMTFEQKRNAFANEFAKAFRSSGGMSRADIEDWQHTINSSMTEDQLRAQVKSATDLLEHVKGPLAEQRSLGYGPNHAPPEMLDPATLDALKRIGVWTGGGKYEKGGQVQPAGPQPAQALPPGPTGHPPSFNDRFDAAQPGAPPQAPQGAPTAGTGAPMPQPPAAAAPQPAQGVDPKAIQYLQQHPETRAFFDQKYGAGASARILGQ